MIEDFSTLLTFLSFRLVGYDYFASDQNQRFYAYTTGSFDPINERL
jgi:hypothetical protein